MKPILLFQALLCLLLHGGALAQTVQTKHERGTLTNGKPTGLWEYYDNNELGLVINYDSGTIRYLRPDTSRYRVRIDSTWQLKRLSRAPRLLGSKSAIVETLQKGLRYPPLAIQQGQMGNVVVSCIIHENGQVSEPFVELTPHPSLSEEVLRVVNQLPLRYLPGIYRGRPTPTRVSFVVTFCMMSTSKPERMSEKEKACITTVPVTYGSFSTVTVTALGVPKWLTR